jgi:hypothetical protein
MRFVGIDIGSLEELRLHSIPAVLLVKAFPHLRYS